MIIKNQMRIRANKIILTLNNVNSPNFSQGENTKIIYSCSLPGYLQSSARIQRLTGFVASTLDLTIYGLNLQDGFAFTRYNITIVQPWINQVQMFSGYLDNLTPQPDGTYLDGEVKSAMDLLPISWLGQVTDAGIDMNSEDRPLKVNSVMTLVTINALGESVFIEYGTMTDVATKLINGANYLQNQNTNPTRNLPTPSGTPPFQGVNAPQRQGTTINYKLGKVFPEMTFTDYVYTGSQAPLKELNRLARDYGYNLIANFTKEKNDDGTEAFYIELSLRNPSVQTIELFDGETAQIINAGNGMIGYPQVEGFGLLVTEYFNPLRRINDLIILDTTYYTPLQNVKLYVWQYNSTLETHDDTWESQLTLFANNNQS